MSAMDLFMTGNTELAAFLTTRGQRLDSVRGNASRAEFYFRESPDLQNTIADFAANAEAPAKTLFDSLKLMKSLAKDAVQSQSIQGRSHHESRHY
jgi:hypothetical protein